MSSPAQPASQPNPGMLDVGNPLLSPVPCQLTATVITGPDGAQALIITVRDPSTTWTGFLDRAQATQWRDLIDTKIATMSTLLTPTQAAAQAAMERLGNQNGRPR